ncbi:MAG TPA: hypothetical protein VMV46_06640 [Thermoanaerobaculia bacterium]|nr:hypothetical protein [Thermoanaerobaculia bacterium]
MDRRREEPGDGQGEPAALAATPDAVRERRQKLVLAVVVAGFLIVSIVGLSSLVILELRRERRHNEELARRQAAARVGQPAAAAAAAATTYLCSRASAPPRIDGAIEEPEWRRAPWSRDLVAAASAATVSAASGSRVRLAWDQRALYLAAVLEPSGTAAPSPAGLELLLAADAASSPLVVTVDRSGAARARPGGSQRAAAAPEAVLAFATGRAEGGDDAAWTLELAVAWAAIGELAPAESTPRAGDAWRIALRLAAPGEDPAPPRWSVLELVAGDQP